MLTLAERVNYIIDCLASGNQRLFAEQCNINYTAFNRVAKGHKEEMPKKYLNAILERYPEIDRKWLTTGEGTPGVSSRSNIVVDLKKLVEEKDKLIEDLQKEMALQRKIIEKLLSQ